MKLLIAPSLLLLLVLPVTAKLADRSRLVKHRQKTGKISGYHDNGRPIEGQAYRSKRESAEDIEKRLQKDAAQQRKTQAAAAKPAPWQMPLENNNDGKNNNEGDRQLSSQLSGCCYNYKNYNAANLCSLYGNDCESGETPSHDSGDDDCSQEGLSFIGISFSVNTASGNPYSYQLCDQFPMENIIDRDYEYIMSMDEDGWLVGGGYKTFDYSGKMP